MIRHIRTKLLVCIVPSVILVLIYGYFWNTQKIGAVLDKQIHEKMVSTQNEQVRRVTEPFIHIQKTAIDTAVFVEYSYNENVSDSYEEILSDIVYTNENIFGMGIWFEPDVAKENSIDKGVYIEVTPDGVVRNDKYFTEEYDYLNAEHYRLAKESGTFGVTSVYHDEVANRYAVTCYAPIIDDGKYIGCVTVDLDLSKVRLLLDEYNTENSIFFIMNNDGIYIEKLDENFAKYGKMIADAKQKAFEKVSEVVIDEKNGRIDFNVSNEDFLLYYSTVEGLNLTLAYIVPKSTITEKMEIISNHYLVVSAIMLLIIVIAILIVMHLNFDKPFKLLLKEFEKIANNTYDLEVAEGIIEQHNEFSEMGEALKTMKHRLYNYRKNLTDLIKENEKNSQNLEKQNIILMENARDINSLYEYNNALINTIPELVFVISKSGVVISCHGDDSTNNVENEFYVDKHISEFASEENAKIILDKLEEISGTDAVKQFNMELIFDEKIENYDMRISDWLDDRVIVIGRNVTEFNNNLKEIEYLSFHDQLTGLHNRRYYERRLNEINQEELMPLSIVMCDVNGLKLINDSFGHEEGDRLLNNFAKVLRRTDIDRRNYAKIGGDEFVILLPNTEYVEAEKIINDINLDCANEVINGIALSVSFGIATMTNMNQNPVELLKAAEDIMYQNKLYESTSRKRKTIDVIVSALQEKNPDERRHASRVSNYCEKLAMEIGCNMPARTKAKSAGLLHDIGKIGTPEILLDKKEGLTDEEYSIMCKHPEIGYRILKSAGNMNDVADVILSHHERWDGTGYPRKLKGEAIPIEARMISIVDAYDTMTSNTTYRLAYDKEYAINELRKYAGTQFDPNLVEVFVTKVLADE